MKRENRPRTTTRGFIPRRFDKEREGKRNLTFLVPAISTRGRSAESAIPVNQFDVVRLSCFFFVCVF